MPANPYAITRLSLYAVAVPFEPLGSHWTGRQAPAMLDSSLVVVETASGLTGVGESCPVDAIDQPAFAAGLRAALGEIAPAVLGEDATRIRRVYRAMDRALQGHGYAKAAIDIACWDLLGQHCAQPVSALFGGRFDRRVSLYTTIQTGSAEDMLARLQQARGQGYRRFQVKVGEDPLADCRRLRRLLDDAQPGEIFMADADGGWSQADALRAVVELANVDCYLEQPCSTYEECRLVRQHCARPMILDEVIDGPVALARAIADDALDALAIKLSHAGGLTPALMLRDLCLARGLRMRIEDAAGTEVIRAAQAQLAAATPAWAQLGSRGLNNKRPAIASGAPEHRDGALYLNDEPGLGVALRPQMLGDPLAVYW